MRSYLSLTPGLLAVAILLILSVSGLSAKGSSGSSHASSAKSSSTSHYSPYGYSSKGGTSGKAVSTPGRARAWASISTGGSTVGAVKNTAPVLFRLKAGSVPKAGHRAK